MSRYARANLHCRKAQQPGWRESRLGIELAISIVCSGVQHWRVRIARTLSVAGLHVIDPATFQKCVTKVLQCWLAFHEMLLQRETPRESGDSLLISRLDKEKDYAEQTRHQREERRLWCCTVLVLTGLLTAFMPLMEHCCRWDHFLQGGSDVEFGILSLLLFAGLVLLIAHRATSPFLLLLAHRLIAFPLRCLLASDFLPLTSSSFEGRGDPEAALAWSVLPLASLRI